MMTAARRSCGKLPCSLRQTKSSWSLVCNTGPPCFQSSGGIPSSLAVSPATLQLLHCLGCLFKGWDVIRVHWLLCNAKDRWGLDRTVGAEECMSENVVSSGSEWMSYVCEKILSVHTAQGTLSVVYEGLYIYCLVGFVEFSVINAVCAIHLSLQGLTTIYSGLLKVCAGGCYKQCRRQLSS